MRFGFWATAVLISGALTLAACDQVPIAEPEASWTGSIGRVVVDGEDPKALEFLRLDGAGPGQGRMSLVPIGGTGDTVGEGEAARLETIVQPRRMESLQARLLTTGDIEQNTPCWLRFDARAAEPQIELGLGRLSIMVQSTEPASAPLFHRSIYLDPDWQAIDFTFMAPEDLSAGEAQLIFGVGTQLQAVDLAGVSMRCFEDDKPAGMPETTFSYAGRDVEAPWRATAEKQIERYRKGDLTIDVVDASGEPVADAEIHIRMARHAFEFGTAIDAEVLAGKGEFEDKLEKIASYRRSLRDLFNTVTLDNDLLSDTSPDEDDNESAEDALEWIRSLELELRGRGLVSTDRADLSETLQERWDEPDAIRDAVGAGIEAMASRLDGEVSAWDVVDRPREQGDLLDLLGWEELATWFRLARSASPEARLVLNENDILAGDRMAELATQLGSFIDADVPIDRIGAQGQFGAQPPPIQVLADRLDQLASFDLPLVVTGFDMATSDEDLKRDFTRDFLTLAFSHPSVEGFVFGRFWDRDGAPDGIALYREDGSITSMGQAYRDLVLRQWWTDIQALSNAEGELTSRVFQGDYVISVRKDDLAATANLSLGAEGTKVTLTLAAKDAGDRAL